MAKTTEHSEKRNLKKDAGRLIATAQNDITIPFFNEVFENTDPILIERGGGKGLEIYEEIERDTQAGALLQKRKVTLIARGWEVSPGGEATIDHEAAEFVEEQLERLPFDRISENLLDATLKGYAISEVQWSRDGGRIIPARIVNHEQRRFKFDEHWQPRLLTQTSMWKGEELPPNKFLVHRVGVKGNRPYGLGLGSKLFFPVLFKREGVAFWLKFLEKFAGPTVVGKTPYGILEHDQLKLLRALERFHTHGSMTVPVDVDVELLEATRSGSMSANEWCNYWDKQMSICILGETLTTDIGAVGSLAAAQVHSGVLDKLVDADGDLLSDTLHEQLLTWMVLYNFPGAAVPYVSRAQPKNEKADAETRKAKADAAIVHNDALKAKLGFLASIDDDEAARDILISSGLVDELEGATIDKLVDMRSEFPTENKSATQAPIGHNGGPAIDPETEAEFAAFRLKKKRSTLPMPIDATR